MSTNEKPAALSAMTVMARLSMVFAFLSIASAASAALAAVPLKVGSGIRDITPMQEMLPLPRAPGIELTGVLDPIHVRVLALSSGGATTLLVCSETGQSLGPQLARELSRHAGVPLEAILFTSTHAYAAPQIADNWINVDIEDRSKGPVGPAGEQEVLKITNQQRWAAYAQHQLLAAADDALAHMKPAAVGIGYATGKMGAAIRFNDSAGKPLAFIVYQTGNGTTMHADAGPGGKTVISADIPGVISAHLEQKYPGSVAVWVSGAGGDQATAAVSGTGAVADVETAVSRIGRYEANAQVNYAYRDSTIPALAGGNYGISLQLLRIGDIALAGFPGELSVNLGKDIRLGSPLKNTLVVDQAWQRPYQHSGYHADDAAIVSGGTGRDVAYKPGYLSKALVGLTSAMIQQTGEWTFNGGTATSRSGRRVIVGPDGVAGSADDNQIMNPAGTVLRKNVKFEVDADGVAFVPLGNGFNLYAGQDHDLGTNDDVVKGFGRYPQSDPNGARSDPLSWRLLDIQYGKAVLASSAQLDSIQFNPRMGDGNDYIRSNLRAWLNSRGGSDVRGDTAGFYKVAFNDVEEARIVPTRLDQPPGTQFGAVSPEFIERGHTYSTAPMDIQDPVWALSGEEAIRYFGPSTLRGGEPSRDGSTFTDGHIVPTAYARARGVKINIGGNGPATVGYGDSWLRTSGPSDGSTFYGMFLSSIGNINGHRPVTNVYGALPVVTVRLSK